MCLLSFIKSRFAEKRTEYSLMDTFGCPECPPQNCPTFLE